MKRDYRVHRVTMIVSNMKQYRVPFYQMLANRMADRGVVIKVLYSTSSALAAKRGDDAELPAPLGCKIPRIYLAGHRFIFQVPPLLAITDADLLVIVQANGILLNYFLLLLSALKIKRVAFWGHGWNRQADPERITERFKRYLATKVDWWFAYTHETKRYLVSIGMDADRITTIENAVDTRRFSADIKALSRAEVAQVRASLGMSETERICLYCGAIDHPKKIPFLLACADEVFCRMPDFRLVVIGSGPLAEYLSAESLTRPYVLYMGRLFGKDRAIYFRIAQLFLHPGAVGLGILDAFAAGLPFLTCKDCKHGPEIDYLEDEETGFMLSEDALEWSEAIIRLLNDDAYRNVIAEKARLAAAHYTIEHMVDNVAAGLCHALNLSR